MTDAAIPDPRFILAAGIDALVALRPAALKHINSGKGRYYDLITGWRATIDVAVARIAREVAAGFLSTAEGDELIAYVASEHDAVVDRTPYAAVGTVTLQRSTGPLLGGVIKKGTKFFRESDPSANPAVESSDYESTSPVVVAAGQELVSVRVRATRPGLPGNDRVEVVSGVPTPRNRLTVNPADLFDRLLVPTLSSVAGGTSKPTDGYARRLAVAHSIGQYGPTAGAVVAAALKAPGCSRVAYFEDPTVGASVLFPADESWATSETFRSAALQRVTDPDGPEVLGFGPRCVIGSVANQYVSGVATVSLRAARFLDSSEQINDAIRTALRAYLDDRPEWYTWKASAIRSVIARCDPRILGCSSFTMTDLAGATLTEPSAISTDFGLTDPFSAGIYATHYFLAGNGVTVTYEVPT